MNYMDSYASVGKAMDMYNDVQDLIKCVCRKMPDIVGPDTTSTLTHDEASKVTHYLNDLLSFIRTTDCKMPFPL